MVRRINPAPAAPHDGSLLFQRLASPAGLAAGWEEVRENGGASGGDRVTCEHFGIGSDQRLAELGCDLHAGSYRPGPLRRVDIPKPAGGVRTLMIPCVRDRVAQSSAAQVLTPLFEAEFEDVSFGYRPGRSVKQALLRVQTLRDEGWRYTLDADIEAYFDNVSHDLLLERLYRSVSESPLTELISLWLETGGEFGKGLAQGSPLSPLLANLFLDDLDEALLKTPLRMVRFADDFVVLARRAVDAEKALAKVADLLAGFGLRLNPRKTAVRGFDDSVRYLGAVFVRSMVIRDTPDLAAYGPDRLLREIAERDRKEEEGQKRQEAGDAALAAAGYDRGVRTLYLQTPGRELGLKNLAFAVRDRSPGDEPTGKRRGSGTERLVAAIHPTRIDRIEVGPDADVSTEAMRNALSFGVEMAFVNGHGETLGTLAAPLPPRARRHLAQARHVLDPSLRLELARLFVTARLKNQRALLRRLNQRRGFDQVDQICSQFARPLRAVAHAPDTASLMGFEGEATAKFWRGWAALLMHGWTLPARRRKPAPDAVNIALNIAAHLLGRDTRCVLLTAGLHPGFGVLHGIDDGRDALVFDFMEIFRAALVESVVLEAFNTRALRPEHFQSHEGGARIHNSGYAALIGAYEERAARLVSSPRGGRRMTWRRLMLEQAQDFAAHVESGRSFLPHLMNY
ncbi:CRISPR-associated Cas1 family protein /RNA-directed DNA polymerase [Hoeflea marina]|uniref:CRISPR-associated endonuclease Cas1 n=1 Tax=Hoeflea marina TaxID=274592 RepID=A0A317PQS2_9HYPH|nr:CRISPR-associated endonuclease Cas1 [Hoeflea marina]PWW03812.1 CRISPR-associated Cas1 family protein /RNA-directed DNA polymerase [Hoeflea marina]